MGTLKRKVAGKRAKYAGVGFERVFESLCAIEGVGCVRIPDGCRQVGGGKMIRVPTPFDYCLCFGGRAAFVDTKTTESQTFAYSMITPHQLRSLAELSPGGRAGYVIGLGDGMVYFVDVALLMDVKTGGRVDFSRATLLGSRIAFDVRRIF